MKLFAQIRKVDEEKRLVFGRAAEEVVDKSDEIMDYASSKPHFVKWSEDAAKDTSGASLGNVRAMHGKVAAGKLTAIDFNDAEKAIDICAKVVDDNEWKKVLEGVYRGFSVGGAYVGDKKVEKADGRNVARYTARPSEISLVDSPCIPTAKFFEVQKSDGTLAKVEFQQPAADAADAADVTVNGTADEVAQLGKVMNEQGLSIADVIAKIAAREDANPKEGESKYGDVQFADEKNKKYPLDTPEHVRAAASYFGKDANRSKYDAEDQKKIDAKIAAAEKKHGIGDDAKKADFALSLRKGLSTCASLAGLLQSLEYICSSVEYEEEREGDGSDLGGRLMVWMNDGGKILADMVAEEVAEVTAGKDLGDAMCVPVLAMAERAVSLSKSLDADLQKVAARVAPDVASDLSLAKLEASVTDALAKIGARNSSADAGRIKKIHDMTVELGAACAPAVKSDAGDLAKSDHGALEKLVADAVAPLQKALDDATAKITKLEAQPAPARISLRAIAKSEDVLSDPQATLTAPAPITDALGDQHEAAGLIKSLHQSGGAPLRK
jgi:hypothetical protein